MKIAPDNRPGIGKPAYCCQVPSGRQNKQPFHSSLAGEFYLIFNIFPIADFRFKISVMLGFFIVFWNEKNQKDLISLTERAHSLDIVVRNAFVVPGCMLNVIPIEFPGCKVHKIGAGDIVYLVELFFPDS